MANKIKDNSSLVEQLVFVNKSSKTITGGKSLSFGALVIVGDKKGKVGFGTGKAKEVGDARAKAFEAAKKTMIKIPLKEGRTIHHDCEGKFGAGKVYIRYAKPGTGVIAGGPMRAIFECLGVHDIVTKSLGTQNPYNMVLATFDALKKLNSPKSIAEKRGKHISDVIKKRNIALNSTKTGDENE
jgi:small subunit ribosomal protein S5